MRTWSQAAGELSRAANVAVCASCGERLQRTLRVPMPMPCGAVRRPSCRRRSLANRPARVGAQGVSMLADVYSNGFPNAHVARWEHPPNAGHTG